MDERMSDRYAADPYDIILKDRERLERELSELRAKMAVLTERHRLALAHLGQFIRRKQ